MQQIYSKIDFLVGSSDVLNNMSAVRVMRTFDERVISFLNTLSGEILKSDTAKIYSDAITFAFWCRKANLLSLKKQYDDNGRLGRGMTFHIAPSNVPLNFAYSMAVSMLAGNANIVRIPIKKFEQTELLCGIIAVLLLKNEFADIAERLCLIKYSRDKKTTDSLSAICSSRIIWGGDATVSEVRKSPLPPRANEITFPDRYSICIINADKYLSEYNKSKTARDFYNDTFLTDQNACTSPRIIIWLGAEREKAKKLFWDSLHEQLDNYELQSIQTMNKLSTFFTFAANSRCILLKVNDYKIMRVVVKKLDESVLGYLENSGYFYEYDADTLDEILPVCGCKCQTLSYIGLAARELSEFIFKNTPFGIDRIVPVGKTMDFSPVWDGRNLIHELSRMVEVL